MFTIKQYKERLPIVSRYMVKMIKITFTSFLLIFLFVFSSFSQETQELEVTIPWDTKLVKQINISPDPYKKDNISHFYFNNANFLNQETLLPYFYKKIPVGTIYKNIEIIVEQEKYAPINESNNLTEVTGYDSIPANLNISYKILVNRRVPNLYVYFIPLRRNAQSGRLEKLISCKITLKLNEPQTSKPKNTFKSATQSVLNSGKWYKIKIEKDGIYKITYDEIVNLGFDNPQNIRVYGNAGGILAFDNNDFRFSSLQENAIWIEKGADGIFNSGDYILFFGQSPHRWYYKELNDMFYHKFHLYSKYSYYFLTTSLGQAKQVQTTPAVTDIETAQTSSYTFRLFHENESENIISSGRRWLGEKLNVLQQYDTSITIKNINTSSPVRFRIAGAASSSLSTNILVNINNQNILDLPFSPISSGAYGDQAKISEQSTSFNTNTGLLNLNFNYNGGFNDRAWIDFFEINARCNLKYENVPLIFTDENMLSTQVMKFNITSNKNIKVWKVTDFHTPIAIPLTQAGSTYTFKDTGEELKEYVMFSPQDALLPEYEGENTGTVANQDLLGMASVNYVIITLSELKEQAERLAKLHRDNSGLSVAVVTLEQIYNEFSSGSPDVSAIRDFIRNLYWKTNITDNNALKHVLLFGDGSYDNRDLGEEFDKLLTYQSFNSINISDSFVGDDFFSFLDDEEGDSDGGMDVGIGRFPADNIQEAEELVNKVETYISPKSLGSWRNRICFIGDDEDGNEHTKNADNLAKQVANEDSTFIEHKIYLDAYKQTASSSGPSYPEVNKAITDNMNRGILVFNYVGHGGPGGMAHERIITVNDIIKWHNDISFPIFITATCEFSRFDDAKATSAGEYVLLNPTGGGIALLTTTRIVVSSGNFQLNKNFFDNFFKLNSEGEHYRLGDLVLMAKNATPFSNTRNFTLLGDPAIKINIPELNVRTDSINEISTATLSDTISAFEKVTISGHIEDKQGSFLSNYSGTVYPIVFDKEKTITTLANDPEESYPMDFNVRENIVFRGKATVNNGRFKFSFIVPKDISYSVGKGLINYYVENGSTDGKGYSTAFYIGGESNVEIKDNTGPEIRLYLNDTNFVSGGITNQSPVFIAKLTDENGINTSTTGIGHDLTVTLDNNQQNIFVLNDFYESDKDSYQNGSVKYQLSDLEPGPHTLTFKAWDIANNSSETFIDFIVAKDENLTLDHVLNYPNPFSTKTWFMFEHNMPNTDLEVSVQILTISGKVVKSIHTYANTTGFGPVRIEWNGRDEFGDKLAKGVYLYRLKVKTSTGLSAEKFQKLVIIN